MTTATRGNGPMTIEEVQRAVQGVQEELAENRRRFLQESKKMIEAGVAEMTTSLAARRQTLPDDVDPDVAAELDQLRREIETERKNGASLRAAHAEAQKATRAAALRSKVHDALLKHGCTRPEMVAAAVHGSLELGADGQSVMATYLDDYGCRVQAPVEQFVGQRCTKDYPELFSKRGSVQLPVYKFTKKQFLDLEYYKKHQAAMDSALLAGEVEGLKVERRPATNPLFERPKG